MIRSAEGSVWRLHKITKPKAWRGGAQILEKEGDARLWDRCEANREWWAKHWQCEESVQNLDDKFWKYGIEKIRGSFTDAKSVRVGKSFEKEQGEKKGCDGKRPQQACTTMFFLIWKNVTSERLIALVDTLVGSLGCILGGEMAAEVSD